MTHVDAHIQPLTPPIHRVQILRERLKTPVDPGIEGVHRHTLHILQQPHDQIPMLRPIRSHPKTAVTHDHRGDPVPTRRREIAVPQHLGVVMSMHIHKTRRQRQTIKINHPPRRRRPQLTPRPHRHNPITSHPHIRPPPRRTRPIHQHGTTQQQIHPAPRSKLGPIPQQSTPYQPSRSPELSIAHAPTFSPLHGLFPHPARRPTRN